MKPNYPCFCSSDPLPSTTNLSNSFTCIKCKNRFHISCYDNPTIQIFNNTITCIRCRLEIIEPYWSLNKFFIGPTILPIGKPVELLLQLKLTEEERLMSPENFKLVVFCTKLKSAILNNFIYEWPSDKFEIIVNSSQIHYNIYSYAYISPLAFKSEKEAIEIKIICKEPLSANSVIGVSFARRVEMKEIAKEIAKKNRLTAEEAKKKYQDIRQSNLEFSMGIPIKDPMTSFILYMPARGYNCEHISCFDLMSFLSFNRINYTNMRWKCPICKMTLNSNEIVIDLYLHKIVKEIRKDHFVESNDKDKFSHIFFDEKGEWKPKEKFSNLWSKLKKTFLFKGILGILGILHKFIGQTNRSSSKDKEKNEVEIVQNTNPNNDKVIEICEEEEEKRDSNTYKECLMIFKGFQGSKENKGEKTNRIFQIFKENALLACLSLKEFYGLLGEIQLLNHFIHSSFIEELCLNGKQKRIDEIYNEIDSEIGLVARLILIWASNQESLLKIVYLISTENNKKNIDFLKNFELFFAISGLLSQNSEEFKKLNPENLSGLSEIFGFFLRIFMESVKKDTKENLKKIVQLISLSIPEFYFPFFPLINKQKSFEIISGFMNSFLLNKTKEEFTEILLSLYKISHEILTKSDLGVLKIMIRLWKEILEKKGFYEKKEILNIVEKWNTNAFLKELIESGKFSIISLINS